MIHFLTVECVGFSVTIFDTALGAALCRYARRNEFGGIGVRLLECLLVLATFLAVVVVPLHEFLGLYRRRFFQSCTHFVHDFFQFSNFN